MHVSQPPESDAVRDLYNSDARSAGFLMNLTRLWAWRPDVHEGFTALRSQLMKHSALTNRDFAVLVSSTASALGDSYCALAWGTKLAKEAGESVAAAVLQDPEGVALGPRDQALAAWARKVVREPNNTQPSDLKAMRNVGLGDREIVEATVFVGLRLAFSSVNDALGVHPDWELVEAAPAAVVRAVDFGRTPETNPTVVDAPAGAP